MAIKFELEAEVRQNVGRGASRRLRYADKVPAIVYGADQDAASIILDHNKVVNALANEGFYTRILTLKTNGKSEQVILKAVQRHPAKPRVLHMDFQRIKANEKLHMHIPLHFHSGDKAPGLKEGGAISHVISDVEVVCLPADLPEHIDVDLSNMQLNETLHLSNLTLPKGVELAAFKHGIEGHDLPVATLHIPRVIEEEAVPTAEEAALAEGAAEGETPTAEQPAGEAKE